MKPLSLAVLYTTRLLYFSLPLILLYPTISSSQSDCEFESVFLSNDFLLYCADGESELVFADEFNGSELNTETWYTKRSTTPSPFDRVGVLEDQNCNWDLDVLQDQNAYLDGEGHLVLEVKEELTLFETIIEGESPCLDQDIGEIYSELFDYTGGMVWGKSENAYWSANDFIEIEMRCKIPHGVGLQAAFWLWSGDEVDFFEYYDTGNESFFRTSFHERWENGVAAARCENDVHVDNHTSEYHLYRVEMSPWWTKLYVDGELRVEEYKYYYPRTGQPFTEDFCQTTLSPLVLEKRSYFEPDAWFTPIFDMGVSITNHDTDSYTGFPGKMLVDFVRVYRRQHCNEAPNPHVYKVPNDVTFNSDLNNIGQLRVEEDVTLTMTDMKANFAANGFIYLEEGATLILDGVELSRHYLACEKWNGIIASQNANILMENGSVIKDAKTGIKLGRTPLNPPTGPIVFDETPTLTMDTYSGLENCDIGIFLGGGHTTSSISGRCWFKNNQKAICAINSSGLTLDKAEFYDNELSIESVNSFLHVRDGNAFHRGQEAIRVMGTFPLASGVDIGDAGEGWNFFFDSPRGIVVQGNEHPAGAQIVNCRFDKVSFLPSVAVGFNRFRHQNNTFENGTNGSLISSTGENFNFIQCNTFSNLSNIGSIISANNSRTTFLGNEFTGDFEANFHLWGAEVIPNVGNPINPAGNCFSEDDPDLVTTVFPWQSLDPFNYHYYDNNDIQNCQEPFTAGNYSKIQSDIEDNNCLYVGIFDLIDPDGDGIDGIDFEDYIVEEACLSCISHEIDQWIDQVVMEGGDDVRTLTKEGETANHIIQLSETILEQWINFGLYVAIETRNYEFAESILAPLESYQWQRRYFGLQLLEGDMAGANYALDALPATTLDQQSFKEVMRVNLILHDNSGELHITDDDVQSMLDIAESSEPSSGYARSVYYLLTGEHPTIFVPDLPNGELRKPNPVSGEQMLFVISNYAKGSANIHWSDEIEGHQLTLFNIKGETVSVNQDVRGIQQYTVSNLPNGIYIVHLDGKEGNFVKKFFIIN